MAAPHHTPSQRDLDLLSAYLDGELTDREHAAVEQRLREDAMLRRTLDELRATITMLHDLPQLKAPRDFTLDREAFQRPTPWWQRLFALDVAFQTVGALGAIASVLVIMLALAFGGESTDDTLPAARPVDPTGIALKPSPLPDEQMTATVEAARTAIAYAGEDLIQTTIVAQSTLYAESPAEAAPPIMTPVPGAFEAEAAPVEEDAGFAPDVADSAEGALDEQQTFAASAPEAQLEDQVDAPAPSSLTAADDVPESAPDGTGFAPTQGTTSPLEMRAGDTANAIESDALDADLSEDDVGVGESVAEAEREEALDEEAEVGDNMQVAPSATARSSPTASPTPAGVAQILTEQPAPDESPPTPAQRKASDDTGDMPWWLVVAGAVGLIGSTSLFIVGRRKAQRR